MRIRMIGEWLAISLAIFLGLVVAVLICAAENCGR